jgi:hypothetical protein
MKGYGCVGGSTEAAMHISKSVPSATDLGYLEPHHHQSAIPLFRRIDDEHLNALQQSGACKRAEGALTLCPSGM